MVKTSLFVAIAQDPVNTREKLSTGIAPRCPGERDSANAST